MKVLDVILAEAFLHSVNFMKCWVATWIRLRLDHVKEMSSINGIHLIGVISYFLWPYAESCNTAGSISSATLALMREVPPKPLPVSTIKSSVTKKFIRSFGFPVEND